MGKDLRGKELGRGISQREDGLYVARYTNKYGKRVQKVLPKLQELRQWLADAQYKEEHSNIDFPDAMTVNAWFEYWIGIKKRTVRPNTVRNYTERYHRNIEPIIGNKMLGLRWSDVDLENRLLTINRSMEYRHFTGEWRIGEPKTLQTILGHSNIGITMNLYVHITEEQKHKEIDLVADALKVI